MKPSRHPSGLRVLPAPGQGGFTMVEISLCIAIIAIAMVAIIGVMPAGLNVQKQNREDTVIDQDAQTLMEAIRTGAMQFNDITNYVDFITVTQRPVDRPPTQGRQVSFRGLFYPATAPALPSERGGVRLAEAEDILGLLSLPRFDLYNGLAVTNFVTAQIRAFSGPLSEKVLPRINTNPPENQLDFAFRYRLTVEIVPVSSGPRDDQRDPAFAQRRFLAQSLFDVRLTFQWPILQVGDSYQVGNNRKTYRTQVSGQLADYPMFDPPDLNILGSGLVRRRFTTGTLVLQ